MRIVYSIKDIVEEMKPVGRLYGAKGSSMDRIRMFYSNLDTKPRILISHFSRYLGFYVEDIAGNTKESDIESLLDIYIVSDAYVKQTSQSLDIKNENKTIVIYLEGWDSEEQKNIHFIRYEEQCDEEFLQQFWDCMFHILFARMDIFKRLIGSSQFVKETVSRFITLYVDNNILQMSMFTRCSPAHRDMFKTALYKYNNFIEKIGEMNGKASGDDLVKYMRLLALYEIDMICMVNSYRTYMPPMIVQEECETLLRKYGDNEELHIIQADISLHLNGVWNKAGNEFSDVRLTKCAYTYLRRGNIYRNYVRDREAALYEYEIAVEKKEDYFIAWFQMGECLKEQMRYRRAVKAYGKVVEILRGRHNKHELSPLEIEYLFKAVLEIAQICEREFKDLEEAQRCVKLAQFIRKESSSDKYFRIVWDDERALKRFFPLIEKRLNEELDAYLEQVRSEEKVYYEYRGSQN